MSNLKPNQKVYDAIAIGFLVGVVVYSIFADTFGLLMLIPLYVAYRLYRGSSRGDS